MRYIRRFSALATLALACSQANTEEAEFSSSELAIIDGLGPMPELPPNPTNAYADDPGAADLGQKLFFEASYSGALTVGDDGANGGLGQVGEKGKVACASCHMPASWFMDTRTLPNNVSLGAGYTTRNAPSLVNVAYYEWFGWGGKQESLWMQAAGSPESKDNTAGNRLGYAHMLYEKYAAEYDAVFPVPLDPALDPEAADAARFPLQGKPKAAATDPDGPWELMTAEDRLIVQRIMANTGKAIEAYERLLVSRNSAFDRFMQGEEGVLGASARRGLKLFIGKAACVACHSGPTFSDQTFHNTGVPQVGENVPEVDDGRFTDVKKLLENKYGGGSQFSDDPIIGAEKTAGMQPYEADAGKFRTKSLLQVAETGPYMHNGSLATLEDVIDFYDRGGDETPYETKDPRMVPLNLSSSERADLVAFLESLSGEPIPAALTAAPAN
jgi:cytochrome c peroxidase